MKSGHSIVEVAVLDTGVRVCGASTKQGFYRGYVVSLGGNMQRRR